MSSGEDIRATAGGASSLLTVEDRAIAAAYKAYQAAMAPRDGDDPTDCMWTAVFAARDVYEAEVERLRSALEALVVDVRDFGEPRRHYRALAAADVLLDASSDPSEGGFGVPVRKQPT